LVQHNKIVQPHIKREKISDRCTLPNLAITATDVII